MENTFFRFVIFTCVTLCLHHELGNAFTIDITPSNANGLIHDDVSMTCRLDNSDGHVREIMVLELSRNDVALALIRSNKQVTIGNGLDSKFRADGRISTSVFDSFIHVTMSDPEVKDSGSYTCLMYFLNQSGVLEETRRSANLTVSDGDMKTAIKYLVDKVSSLEQQLVSKETQIQSLTNQVEVLQKTENTTVTFVATHKETGSYVKGKVLVYANTVENVGGGYDSALGVFTAPVAGYYFFSVSVFIYPGNYIYVDLRDGRGEILTTLFSGAYDGWHDQGVGTCVAKLAVGDQVKPVIGEVYGSSSFINGRYAGHRLNTFYGYLIRSL